MNGLPINIKLAMIKVMNNEEVESGASWETAYTKMYTTEKTARRFSFNGFLENNALAALAVARLYIYNKHTSEYDLISDSRREGKFNECKKLY